MSAIELCLFDMSCDRMPCRYETRISADARIMLDLRSILIPKILSVFVRTYVINRWNPFCNQCLQKQHPKCEIMQKICTIIGGACGPQTPMSIGHVDWTLSSSPFALRVPERNPVRVSWKNLPNPTPPSELPESPQVKFRIETHI